MTSATIVHVGVPAAPMTSATIAGTGAIRSWVRADPRWRIAAVSVAVGTGHRADRDGTRGLAHLGEHLVMRHRPGPGAPDLFGWLDAIGGIASAHTWPDHTVFTALVPPVAAEAAVRRFAAAVTADDAPAPVLAEEIGKVVDEVHALGPGRGFPWGTAAAALHGGDPALADGYGDPAQLRSLTADQVRAFRHRHYTPGNTAVTVVGDVDPDRLTPVIAESFAVPGSSELDSLPTAAAEPAYRGEPLSASLLAYRMPAADRQLSDYLAVLVLATVVTGRLGAAGHRGRLRAGWFGRPFTVRRDDLAMAHFPAADPRAARRFFRDCLAELATRPIAGPELARATERIRLDLRRRLDSPEGYAAEVNRTALLLPEGGAPELVADRVRQVSAAELSRAAIGLLGAGGGS
jgi:predicted Zn-dependent peptidase